MKVQQRVARDVLVRDGETAVLVDDVLVRLGELSSVIYTLCEAPIDVERLSEELEMRFGSPAGRTPLAATADAVAEMLHAGVIALA